jgi:hypothetical protein
MTRWLRRVIGGGTAVLLAAGLTGATEFSRAPGLFRAATSAPAGQGYWLLAADGGVFSFGASLFFGPNRNQGADIVAGAGTPDAGGYWMVDDDGDVFAYGNAVDFGSRAYNANDVVAFAARRQGDGYWIVASDGGVFSFGDARFFGSTGAIALNRPIRGMAATPTGNGYWLVASDGGIFSFGDARFHGSTGGLPLTQPIVGMMDVPPAVPVELPVVVPPTLPPRPDARPVAVGDQATLDEDSSVTIDVLANDTGLEDGGLVVGIEQRPQDGTVAVTFDRRIVYTPDPDDAGADSFVYRVTDADGDTATATVSVMVIATGDLPRITGIADQLIDEDTSTVPLPFTVTDPDTNGPLTVRAVSSNPTLVPDSRIALGGGGLNRTVTVTPLANSSGSARITLTVSNLAGATASTAFDLFVAAVDDQPVAADDTADAAEDQAVTIDVAANDAGLGDGGVTVTVVAATLDEATEGTATVDGTSIRFTPAPDTNGPATFSYSISDADADTSVATVTVFVAPVNDGPAIAAIDNVTAVLGVVGPVTVRVSDVDDPADTLTVRATSSDQALVVDSDLTVAGTADARILSIVLQPGATGTALITVTVTDPTGDRADTTFTLTAT